MYKILVVDDDPAMCRLLEFHLKKAGFKVRVANDAIEGLKIALEERPDIIISDYIMPTQTGQQFCVAVRDHDEIASTPFIVITGKGTDELKTKGLSELFDEYLEKPIDIQYLVAKVNAIIRRFAKILNN